MKIVHVIATLDPSFGGPSVSAPSTAAAQAALGHDVHIVFYADEDYGKTVNVLRENIPGICDVTLVPVTKNGIFERFLAINAKSELRRLILFADIVHLQGVWRPILLAAAQTAIKYNKKYVISPRGMLDPWSLQQRTWKKRIGLLLGWKTVINNAHFIHALNSAEAELLRPLDISADVRVFPNGAFPEKFARLPDRKLFHQQYKPLHNKPYILFLSRLHYKKGLDYLIDAFVELAGIDDQIHLVIAGPDGGLKNEAEALVKKHLLGSRVHIVGPLYGDIKYSALTGAACFCLPSRQEGFSMAITEALACGTPVVISDQCHFDEVEAWGAGRVVPLEVSAVVKGLCDIIQCSAEERQQMSDKARRLVFENFSWHVIAEKILEAYK